MCDSEWTKCVKTKSIEVHAPCFMHVRRLRHGSLQHALENCGWNAGVNTRMPLLMCWCAPKTGERGVACHHISAVFGRAW